MKKNAWIIGVLIGIAAQPGQAMFGGRDKISSLLPEKPVLIDGHATEWPLFPVLEESGLGIRAMNDASNLYILIRATTDDGRAVMSGKYEQTVTLWFLKPDMKSKDWGINLDFSQVQLSTSPEQELNAVTPIEVRPQGLEVSTQTLSSEIEFQSDVATQNGRQPIYEMRIPLSMFERKDRSIFLDVVSSEVSADVKQEIRQSRAAPAQHEKVGGSDTSAGGQGSAPSAGGGRHHRGMGGSSAGGGQSGPVEVPKPFNLHLTIQLSKTPK